MNRPADLELGAPEAGLLLPEGVLDESRRLDMQPAALGRVEPDPVLRAASHHVQRQAGPPALQVPQSRVDGRHGDGREGTDRRSVSKEQEAPPDLFDQARVTSEDGGRERALDEPHDRGAAGADRIGVAGPGCPIRVRDADEGCLLADEGLDRVDPLHLRDKIDHERLDADDFGHALPFLVAKQKS